MTTRIAFCITDLNQGGAERQFVESILRLPRDRFDPTVIALSHPPQPPEDRLLQHLREREVPVTFLLGRRGQITPRDDSQ